MVENRLETALERGEFAVTCEMVPGRGAFEAPLEKSLQVARDIYATGRVDAISITDNPGGKPAILADAIARELDEDGVCTLTHFTCKDRSRNQIAAQLYALERAGLHNVLFMTGDYQTSGWQGQPRPDFDLDSVQIQQLAHQMNEGLSVKTPRGTKVEQPTHFFCGCVVNPFKYREGELIPQYLKLEKKLIAGARFVIAQVGYDARKLQELLFYLEDRHYDVPVIANVFVLTRGAAKLMRSGAIAGVEISDELAAEVERDAAEQDGGRARRVERAARQVAIARGLGCAGVHIGGSCLDAAMLEEVLDRAERIGDSWRALVPESSYGRAGGCYLYAPELAADGTPTGLNERKLDIVREDIGGRRLFKSYRLSRFFHYWMLTLDKRLGKCLAWNMDRKEKKYGGPNFHHRIEHAGKAFIYGCKDCGDCGLEATIHSCPMAQCPKSQRNGPCGGSDDGWCEVYPHERYCIWYMAYHRANRYGELERMESFITPPIDWSLRGTSAWSNYTHRRDNAAHRTPIDIGLD